MKKQKVKNSSGYSVELSSTGFLAKDTRYVYEGTTLLYLFKNEYTSNKLVYSTQQIDPITGVTLKHWDYVNGSTNIISYNAFGFIEYVSVYDSTKTKVASFQYDTNGRPLYGATVPVSTWANDNDILYPTYSGSISGYRVNNAGQVQYLTPKYEFWELTKIIIEDSNHVKVATAIVTDHEHELANGKTESVYRIEYEPKFTIANNRIVSNDNFNHDTNWSVMSGWGEINATKALNQLLDINLPTIRKIVDDNGNYHYIAGMDGFIPLHEMGLTGKGVKVAILDTGIDINNPYLTHHLSPLSRCFASIGLSLVVTPSLDIVDTNSISHGTAMASVITSTDPRVKGLAPEAEIVVLDYDPAPGGITLGPIGLNGMSTHFRTRTLIPF
jgi:subtilisin family serine protease